MQRYKVTGPRSVLDTEPGGEFEHAFTEEQEADHLNSRRLEIVPREYEVLAGVVYGTEAGKTFKAALRMHEERALIEGGAIEPVTKKAARAAAKPGAAASTKEG